MEEEEHIPLPIAKAKYITFKNLRDLKLLSQFLSNLKDVELDPLTSKDADCLLVLSYPSVFPSRYSFIEWLASARGNADTEGIFVRYVRQQIRCLVGGYMDMDKKILSIFDLFKRAKEEETVLSQDLTLGLKYDLTRKAYADPTIVFILDGEREYSLYDRNLEFPPTRLEVLNFSLFEIRQRADVTQPSLRERIVDAVNFMQLDLKIKPSQIEGAGYGLFARRMFKPGETITTYSGIWSRNNYSDGLPQKDISHYVATIGGWTVDGERFFRLKDLGRWANHTRETEEVNAKLVYTTRQGVEQPPKVTMVSLGVIFKGEEILIDYGADYWGVNDVCAQCREKIVNEENIVFHCPDTKMFFCSDKCHQKFFLYFLLLLGPWWRGRPLRTL